MPLVVEDGSIVAGANSYATLDEIRAHAQERGIILPADNVSLEVLAIKAMDYIEAQEAQFQGYRVSDTQPLSWPRTDVVLHGHVFPVNTIPSELVRAQSVLAAVINTGVDMLPTRTKPAKKSVRIGPIATEYALNLGAATAPVVSAVDALLAPLFIRYSGLKVIRV